MNSRNARILVQQTSVLVQVLETVEASFTCSDLACFPRPTKPKAVYETNQLEVACCRCAVQQLAIENWFSMQNLRAPIWPRSIDAHTDRIAVRSSRPRRLNRFEALLARAREHKHAVFGNVPRNGGRQFGRKIEEAERGGEGGVRGLGHGFPWIECLLFEHSARFLQTEYIQYLQCLQKS